jgi:hypothetical protein
MDSRLPISVLRALGLLAATVTLAGCGSYSTYAPQIAKSRAEYERAVLSGHPAAVRRTVYAKRATPRPRAIATNHNGASANGAASTGAVAADPQAARASTTFGSAARDNPYPVGTPEWHAEWKRMDESLQRRLNSICARC